MADVSTRTHTHTHTHTHTQCAQGTHISKCTLNPTHTHLS